MPATWNGRVASSPPITSWRRWSGACSATIGADAELWKRYDWEFHHALISACGSQVLLDTHSAIYDKYLRYQMVAVIFRGKIAADEHQLLLDYALKRSVEPAVAVLTTHVNACVDHTLDGGRL